VTTKVAVWAPPGTVTDGATDATAGLALESVTPMPPTGAGPVRVTVPTGAPPPATVAGLRVTDEGMGRVTVSVAVRDCPARLAVSVTGMLAATGVVATGNVAAVAPAGTVTLSGTVAAPLLEERATARPPAGAAAESVTVPVELAPPTSEVGASERPPSEEGVTVSTAVRAPPESAAESVINVGVETEPVLTVKEALEAPAGTTTLAGTAAAAALLLDNATVSPPEGAGMARLTRPCAVPPLTTEAGVTDKASPCTGW
jgi:hypothetical protein